MCFSATASFVAGSLLFGTGLTTTYMARQRRELPLAAMPLLFGVQQISEGFVWKSDISSTPAAVGVAGYLFLFFALVLWPTWVPVTMLLVEPQRWRQYAITGLAISGFATSCFLGYGLLTHSVSVSADERRLVYHLAGFHAGFATVVYLFVTCLSSLLSSHRALQLFGVLVIVLGYGAYQLNAHAFVSVWCFIGAVLSIVVVAYFCAQPRLTARDD